MIIVAILLIDQALKIWVKTSMTLHESIHITDWFYITFIENNGMAFGMQLGSKIVLSLFRVSAIALLGYYIWLEVGKKAKVGYLVCLSMILAGAAGNLIDCMFYGLVFNNSSEFYQSYFVPFGTGYAPFLMGKVVDMFYFLNSSLSLPPRAFTSGASCLAPYQPSTSGIIPGIWSI